MCTFSFNQKRVETFADLLEKGLVTAVSVDTSQTEQLLRLLDTVVIKLEDGTEEDLLALDEKPVEVVLKPVEPQKNGEKIEITKTTGAKGGDEEDWDVQEVKPDIKKEKTEEEPSKKTDIDEKKSDGIDVEEPIEQSEKEKKDDEDKPKKRKRSRSGSSSSSSDSSDSDDEEKTKTPIDDSGDKSPKSPTGDDDKIVDEEKSNDVTVAEEKDCDEKENGAPEKMVTAEEVTDEKEAAAEDESAEKMDEDEEDASKKPDENEENKKEEGEEDGEKTETIDLDKEKDPKDETGPRALHKTSSIFLRNLAPTITKSEVEQMCQKYNGFLRVAIADPLGERRWFRRGWVTFRRDVNIKEICWNLNNIRVS